MKKLIYFGMTIIVLGGCIFVGYRYGAKQGGMMQRPVGPAYVFTGTLEQKDIAPTQKFIALVEPINAVDLKPQITGVIENVAFQNGGMVQEGETLFTIEQDRYAAAVQIAQANVDKAQAHVAQIQSDYNRQEDLFKQKFLPKAELEIAESNLAQAKAQLKQAEADLKLAEINLGYTTITSPISGRIGRALVTKGNYVASTTNALARVVQIDPIRITFSLTDKEALNSVLTDGNTKNNTKWQVLLSNGRTLDIVPENIFIDNEVDSKTATLAVYIETPNTQHLLIPGNYVTIILGSKTPQQALLVPQTAVMQDGNGTYVMKVVDGKAQQQYIDIGDIYEDAYILKKGLMPQDEIVLSGGQKLLNGQEIKSTKAS